METETRNLFKVLLEAVGVIITENDPIILIFGNFFLHIDTTSVLRDHCVAGWDIIHSKGICMVKNWTQEQALVVRDFGNTLQDSTDADNVKHFLKSLKSFCKEDKYFQKFLQPTQLRKDKDGSSIENEEAQESLFRIFLKVPCIQSDVIEVLLDAITLISSDDSQNNDTSWLRSLLKPLRCLPAINMGTELTTRLLDILEIGTFAAQLEILDAIPEILPDVECDQTAKQLAKLLDENDELSGAIVDCLNVLNLDSEVRAQVEDRILAKILAGTSLKIFPILLQFLLSECKSQNLVATLHKVRNALDTIMISNTSNKEKESCKILIFHLLETNAISQKGVCDAWLTTILNIKSQNDHKSIYCLVMFMLHNTFENKKRFVEAIFRKKVSGGLFKINLLERTFDKYMPQQLIRNYISSIINIGCCLLRSAKDPVIAEFGTTMFHLLFNHPHINSVYRSEMLSKLLVLTGSSDVSTITCVLKLIKSLVDIDFKKVSPHMGLLMQLLEKLDTLDLKDLKIVFEILCSLSCSENADQSLSGFKDEIHILIRKKLSSSERTSKYAGIISAIVMVKHIASTEDDQSDIELEDSLTFTDLKGIAKEAASILELVKSNISNCPELNGLYYDQLASVFAGPQTFNRYFLYWLAATVTDDFQSTYITDIIPVQSNDLSFSMQFNINKASETDGPLGIDIVSLSLKEKNNKILVLASNFRLLRLLHYRQHNEDLQSIDALLGCGLILPSIEDPKDLDSVQIKQVVDCLFYGVNWFREVISAFVNQKGNYKRKVIQRLQDLIDIEKKLFTFLDYTPTHNLPASYFDIFLNTTKNSSTKSDFKVQKSLRKRLKTNETINDTTLNTQKSQKVSTSTKKASTSQPQIQFRELDTDVISLLRYPLKICDDFDITSETSQFTYLKIEQLKFLLMDFVTKLSILTQNKDIGLSHLSDVAANNLIKDCVEILKHLNKCLGVLVTKIRNLVSEADGILDSPELFNSKATEFKTCFGLILESLHIIFKWPGFQHSSNLDLLRDLLKSMRSECSQSLNSANRLISEFISQLSGYTYECLHLNHAVYLIKMMESLYFCTTPNEDASKQITDTCAKLLRKRWYNSKGLLDHGKYCNSNIDVLIKGFLRSAKLKKIYQLSEKLVDECRSLKDKEDNLETLPAIDKQNFHVYYLELMNAILNRIKVEIPSLTNNQHLELWRTTADTLTNCVEVVKIHETRTNLASFLKKSIGILKLFLVQGVPILEIMIKRNPDDVVEVFKKMQHSTRYLHNLCVHSRVTQDSSLVAHVPKFRHILESLVFRVKAALVGNNCSPAFWMGNLKNKDLHGEEIVTQSQSTIITNEEDNDQLPSDDDDDERLIINEINDSCDSSNTGESEVF